MTQLSEPFHNTDREKHIPTFDGEQPVIPYGKVDSATALGALVRRKREEAGVRQADAAAFAGVGTRFLSELERGKHTAEVGKVLQVLQRLGLELWLLPRGVEPPRHPPGNVDE